MSRGVDVTVLHVDDDSEFCTVVAEHLERVDDGLDVITESSPQEGLSHVETDAIDCVVSDFVMPEMDGLEFLQAVREVDDELPFILFTGKGSEDIAAEAITAGVTGYIQKRTGTDQYALLANRIRRAVGERRAKTALEESERMLSTLIANLPGMVYRCRNEEGWPMIFVSDGARELTGYAASAIEAGEVSFGEDVIHEDDGADVRDSVETAIAVDEPFELTYRIVTAEDEIRWVWEQGRLVDVDDEGELLEGFVTDITARKTRERELEAERQFTRNVIDALEDVFFLIDADGAFVRWNDRLNEVTGYTDQELASKSVVDVVPLDYHQRLFEARRETMETGAASFDVELESVAGDRVPFEFRSTQFRDAEGAVAGICGLGRDVSEREERKRELDRYRTLVTAVGDPVYAVDEDGKFTFANEAFESLTGYDPDDLIGRGVDLLLSDTDVERRENLIAELLRDPGRTAGTVELDVVTREGEHVPCENHVALLPMEDGAYHGTVGVIREIADRKERERRLEEFASVVSHDLRNPLNVIQGRVELTQETGDTEHLDAVGKAADRMERLIDDLLTLARQGEGIGERHTVDIARLARECWSALEPPEGELVVDEPGTVNADPDRLRELLQNLFRNAIDHAAGDGEVTVRVGGTEAGFVVADDGPGIPADRREAVLQRGYTTSEEGTGFGLAIVADIVEAHGWSIAIAESAGGGARFEITV